MNNRYKRVVLLLCVFLHMSFMTFAQYNVIYSESFPEPEVGDKQLVTMKDGTTAYFNVTDRYLDVRIYDKDRKRTGLQKIDHEQWTDRKMSAGRFLGVCEVSEQLVMFVSQQLKKNTPIVRRVIIDSKTGKFISSAEIVNIGPDRERIPFEIYYDDITQSYAVLYPDDNEHTSFKAVVFDSTHKQTAEGVLVLEGAERIRIKNVCFNNAQLNVFLNRTTKKDTTQQQALFYATLKLDANVFTIQETGALIQDNAILDVMYDMNKGYFQIASCASVIDNEKKNMLGVTSSIHYHKETEVILYDPVNNKILNRNDLASKKLSEYAKQNLDIEDYSGMLKKQLVNEDGSTDLIFESLYMVYPSTYCSTKVGGDIGIVHYDAEMRVVNVSIIDKPLFKAAVALHYVSSIQEYSSTSYFTNGDAVYVVYNDIPDNNKRLADKELKPIGAVTESNTIVYKIKDNQVERDYLFGTPRQRFDTKFSMVGSAVYSKGYKTYTTIMVSANKKGDKLSRIAWVDIH